MHALIAMTRQAQLHTRVDFVAQNISFSWLDQVELGQAKKNKPWQNDTDRWREDGIFKTFGAKKDVVSCELKGDWLLN